MGNYFEAVSSSFDTGTHDQYEWSLMIISWIVLVPVLFLSVFLIITLIGPGQLPKSIRIVLINILVAVFAFAVIGLVTSTLFFTKYDCLREIGLAKVDIHVKNQSIESFTACVNTSYRIIFSYDVMVLFGYPTMVSVTLVFMAFYGILVYIYIRYVFYKIDIFPVIFSCIWVWIIVILVNVPTISLYFSVPVLAPYVALLIPLTLAIPVYIISIFLPIQALHFINKFCQ